MPGSVTNKLLVAVLRRGERVVARRPLLGFVVLLEHREVDDPQRTQSRRREAALVADLGPQRAQRVVDDLLAVGAEEHEVAGLRAGAREDLAQHGLGQELDDRRLQAVLVGLRRVVDLEVREPAGAVDLDEDRESSISLRVMPVPSFAPPGTRSAATRPFGRSAAARKTLKSTVFISSVRSVSSSETRRSGLSEPYFAITSA